MPLSQSDKAVLTKYPIAPSKCVICLRSSNGQLEFIDFEMSLDIYGSVNICVDCMLPVAQMLGLVKADEIESLNEQIRNLTDTNRELHEENGKLRSTLDSLFDLRPDLKQRDLPTDEESESDSKSDEQQLTLDLGVQGADNRKSSKSDAGRGLKDLALATDEFDL